MQNINTKAIPFNFLRLLICIERSIKACENARHLANVRDCWLARLNREYGSTTNPDMRNMIAEVYATWLVRGVELRRAQARRIEEGNRIINALDLSY